MKSTADDATLRALLKAPDELCQPVIAALRSLVGSVDINGTDLATTFGTVFGVVEQRQWAEAQEALHDLVLLTTYYLLLTTYYLLLTTDY